MNRSDFAWALNAVLPHVGKHAPMNVLGIDFTTDETLVYATDDYTAGLARVTGPSGFVGRVHLTAKEATELMRYVRPDRVPERVQELTFAARAGELHVGYESESGVFDTEYGTLSTGVIHKLIRWLAEQPPEWDELIIQPKLTERFAKAQREDVERMRILPRHSANKHGAAIVIVGTDFIGAIAGMSYDNQGPATVADFLTNTEGLAA